MLNGWHGKAGQQHIVVGNFARGDFGDVARDLVRVRREIRPVCPIAVSVPFAGEHAFSTHRFEAETHPSDTRKQVDKREVRIQGSDIILA